MRILMAVLMVMMVATPGMAREVCFGWQSNPVDQLVTEYTIYQDNRENPVIEGIPYGDERACLEVVYAPRFEEATLEVGLQYYIDRDYSLTDIPTQYVGMSILRSRNTEKDIEDATRYLTFTMGFDGVVFVGYDERATALPMWLRDFEDTGVSLGTSLETQPGLKIYAKEFRSGDLVDLGGNKAEGFEGNTVSNYITFVGGPVNLLATTLDRDCREYFITAENKTGESANSERVVLSPDEVVVLPPPIGFMIVD